MNPDEMDMHMIMYHGGLSEGFTSSYEKRNGRIHKSSYEYVNIVIIIV